MANLAELTTVCEQFMLSPRAGPGVCGQCFNFTRGFERCYACSHNESWLDAIVPIAYSVAQERLHHMLMGYKRLQGEAARQQCIELAAVLWRFLEAHEACVATAASTTGFELVTTVPSGDAARDERHPLRWIVGHLIAPTKDRHARLLRRSQTEIAPRTFDSRKYDCTAALNGESVLLVDDTWTTGTSAQSAAAALKSAGAGPVGIVVIGRHLNREWHENDRRLRGISRPLDWHYCAVCGRSAQSNG